MAKPESQGINYFPTDVDLDLDDKLAMIIGEFGYKGEIIYIKLLSWIYKNQGYYCVWDEMEQLKFTKRVSYLGNPSVNLIKEIVARCIKWGLFDQIVFDSLHILTSKRIQSTWLDATRKRKKRIINENIWIKAERSAPAAEEVPKKAEDLNKVKESKVNKSKLSKSHSGANAPVNANKNITHYWEKIVEVWFVFYKEKFSLEPTFNPAAAKSLKSITARIKKIAEQSGKEWTEEYALYCVKGFFIKAHGFDNWLRDNFLLPTLLNKFDAIIKRKINNNYNSNGEQKNTLVGTVIGSGARDYGRL